MAVLRCVLAVFVSTWLVTFLSAGENELKVPENPLNEKAWPALLQPRFLEIAEDEVGLPRLLKERYNAAQEELRDRYIYWLQDIGTLDQVYAAAKRAMEARLAVSDPPADGAALLDEKVEMAKFIERQVEALLKTKRRAAKIADQKCARYYRLDAEIGVLQGADGQPPELTRGGSSPRVVYLRHIAAEEAARVVADVLSDSRAEVEIEARGNTVLVVASEELFWQVKELIEALDLAAGEPDDGPTVVRLKPKNRTLFLQKKIEAIEKGMKASEREHWERLKAPKNEVAPDRKRRIFLGTGD